jgi:hypothetical protein
MIRVGAPRLILPRARLQKALLHCIVHEHTTTTRTTSDERRCTAAALSDARRHCHDFDTSPPTNITKNNNSTFINNFEKQISKTVPIILEQSIEQKLVFVPAPPFSFIGICRFNCINISISFFLRCSCLFVGGSQTSRQVIQLNYIFQYSTTDRSRKLLLSVMQSVISELNYVVLSDRTKAKLRQSKRMYMN